MFDWIGGHLAGVVATTGEVNAMEPEETLVLQELEGGGELSKLVGFDVVGHLSSLSNSRYKIPPTKNITSAVI